MVTVLSHQHKLGNVGCCCLCVGNDTALLITSLTSMSPVPKKRFLISEDLCDCFIPNEKVETVLKNKSQLRIELFHCEAFISLNRNSTNLLKHLWSETKTHSALVSIHSNIFSNCSALKLHH